jgi:hypothetical protein
MSFNESNKSNESNEYIESIESNEYNKYNKSNESNESNEYIESIKSIEYNKSNRLILEIKYLHGEIYRHPQFNDLGIVIPDLRNLVYEHLKNGYELYSEIYISINGLAIYGSQTVVKYYN